MKEKETFWMCYAEGHESPKFKHCTMESASQEAERLTEKLGVPVYVLQAVEEVSLHKFEHVLMREFDTPF